MPWYFDLAAKLWRYLTDTERGKTGERFIITSFSIIAALFAYSLTMDHWWPTRNLLRRIAETMRGQDTVVFSGGPGGVYIRIGEAIEDWTRGGSNVVNKPTTGGSPQENIRNVLRTRRSFALCQEDELHKSKLGKGAIQEVAPLYEERLHILYRQERWDEIVESVTNRKSHQELSGEASSRGSGDDEEDAVVLKKRPHEIVRLLIETSRVRLASKAASGSKLGLTARILQHISVNVSNPKYMGITASIAALKKGDLDVAFLTGGTPLPGLSELEPEDSIKLLELDPDLISDLRTRLGAPFVQTSVKLDGAEEGSMTTLGIRAMLIASRDMPKGIIRDVAAAVLKGKEREHYQVEIDSERNLERIADTWPSRRLELAGTVLWMIVTVGIYFVVFHILANQGVSFFKEVGYTRALTNVYSTRLPDNHRLANEGRSIKTPVGGQETLEIAENLIQGTSEILGLLMKIRADYNDGGLTIRHQKHLVEMAYTFRAVFQDQLGRRLLDLLGKVDEVNEAFLQRLYVAGYLSRDAYLDCQRSLAQLKEGDSTNLGASPGVAESPAKKKTRRSPRSKKSDS